MTLYLLNVLKFDKDTSTVFFNGFTVLCYTSPLFGSILADGYIGKFMTIFVVSIFYAMGQVILAGSSVASAGAGVHPWLDLAAFAIIGLGTGGIKPCVSSFGGDQFEPHQEKMISIFFSFFYFSINAGAMISTFISPIFRATPCMGQDSCYPLAFGVPAALMIASTLIFISGSFWYKKPPPKVNIFGEVFRVFKASLQNRLLSTKQTYEQPDSHCLDYYFETHECTIDARCLELQKRRNDSQICQKRLFVDDIKSLLRVLVIFIPMPIFWALYDQQGSRWLIQSIQMDCKLWDGVNLLPDQMQTLNAILILVFIPIFQFIIYPLFSLCFKLTPLRKMVAGGLIAALAFVVSASVQFQINYTLPDLPPSGRSYVSVMNALDNSNITVAAFTENGNASIAQTFLEPNKTLTNNRMLEQREMLDLPSNSQVVFNIGYNGPDYQRYKSLLPTNATYHVSDGTFYLLVSPQGTIFRNASTDKPTDGTGAFSIGITLALNGYTYKGNLALCQKTEEGKTADSKYPCDPRRAENFYYYQVEDGDLLAMQKYRRAGDKNSTNVEASIYKFKSVRPGKWALYYLLSTVKRKGEPMMKKEEVKVDPVGVEFEIEGQGGIYLLAVTGDKTDPKKRIFQVAPENQVSILWQIPQIAILTAAEILFSITGLEFAYSQAAVSMKSLVAALWLLTTALGDALIVIITLFRFSDMALELLFYAGLMTVVTVILALLAIFYYEYNNSGENAINYNCDDEDEMSSEWCSSSPAQSKPGDSPSSGRLNEAFSKAEETASLGGGKGF